MKWITAIYDYLLDNLDDMTEGFKSYFEANFKIKIDLSSSLQIIVALVGLAILAIRKLITSLSEDTTASEFVEGEENVEFSGKDIVTSALGKQAPIVSKYGDDRSWNRTPLQRLEGKTKHEGIDISTTYGSPVHAIFDGDVISVNESNSGIGGRSVTVKSTSGRLVSYFAHLSKVQVSKGMHVFKGQIIGNTGASGKGKDHAYISHLYLQTGIITGGVTSWIDPLQFGKKSRVTESPLEYSSLTSSELEMRDIETSKYGIKSRRFNRLRSFNDDVTTIIVILMNRFQLKDYQASGLVGNFIRESNLHPMAASSAGGSLGAQGIAQWRGDRVTAYKSMFGKMPYDDPSLAHQVQFVVHELKSNKSRCVQKLREVKNYIAAADIGLGYYEFSSGPYAASRSLGDSALFSGRKYANEALSIYRNSVKAREKDILSKGTVNSVTVSRLKHNQGYRKQ